MHSSCRDLNKVGVGLCWKEIGRCGTSYQGGGRLETAETPENLMAKAAEKSEKDF